MPFDPDFWAIPGQSGQPEKPTEQPAEPRPAPPASLGEEGAAFWRDVVSTYKLRPDELRVLRGACGRLDLIERLEAELAQRSTLRSVGSMGQPVAEPLAQEVRQQWTAFRQLVGQLKLPDQDDGRGAGRPGERTVSEQARRAAQIRWNNVAAGESW